MAEKEKTEVSKRLLTVSEAARFLGISPRSLYNQTGPKSKKPFPVKPKRIGKSVRFDVLDLEKLVARL